jgi:MerR family transcriptional regulator, copper efflux regulator
MQIGELAKKAGVSVQTVRFYERRGLLPNPIRKESGYRAYGETDLKRLLFIRQAKALGFSLDEIRTILKMRDRGQCPCASVLRLAEQHLETTERQISQLAAFRDELRGAIRKWKRSGQHQLSADAFCILIENTMRGGSPHGATKGRRTA